MKGFSAVLGLALLCWAAVPGQAVRATTLESIDLEQLARSSDVIVRGRVVSVVAFPRGPNGLPGIHTRVEIAAEEFLAGAPVSLIHVWVQGGQYGDQLRVVSGQAEFQPGEDVVVFLFEASSTVLFPNGMGAGKWRVQPGPTARVVQPKPHHASLVGAAPSAPRQELPLQELRDRVRAARGE